MLIVLKLFILLILKNRKQPCINQYGISQLIYDTHNHIQNVSDFRAAPDPVWGVKQWSVSHYFSKNSKISEFQKTASS